MSTEIIDNLKATFGDGVTSTEFRGEFTVLVPRERIVDVLRHLKNNERFEMLVDETAIDYMPREPRFAVLYQLYSLSRNVRLRLKVFLSEYEAQISSACAVYENANWLEREIYDLMGITFLDHPDLRRILLPPGYDGHPLRKEIPVKVEEVAFSFNRRRIDESKIYAGE